VYTPEYADGEIVIFFKEDPRVGKGFVGTYIEILYGEELDIKFNRCEEHGDLYVFSVAKGKEEEYCSLIKQDKLVTGAERLDERLQRRFKLYDQITSNARDLEGQFESDVDSSGLRKLLDKWDES